MFVEVLYFKQLKMAKIKFQDYIGKFPNVKYVFDIDEADAEEIRKNNGGVLRII